VAYPDPKIVTVAAPTTTVNATRPPRAHPHAQQRASSTTSSATEAVNNRAEVPDLACKNHTVRTMTHTPTVKSQVNAWVEVLAAYSHT
jgi:hypothetical protein